jgi:hypothetical protein
MSALGETLFFCDKDEEAKDLLRQALQLHIKVFGPEDKKTFSVKSFLKRWFFAPSPRSSLVASDSGWALEDEPEEVTENRGEEGAGEAGPPKARGEQDRNEDVSLDLTNLEITEEDLGT